jgi:GTP-binding nuclear protein Ran
LHEEAKVKFQQLTYAQEFVAAPALAPPEVQVDQAAMQEYQKEMEDAAAMPLPDEEDPDL